MAFEDVSHIDTLPAPRSSDNESCVLEQHVGKALERQCTVTRALRSIAFSD